MGREGGEPLEQPKYPIAIFLNGAMARVMHFVEGKVDNKGRSQIRFLLEPYRSFKLLYNVHQDDYNNSNYPHYFDWSCPKIYVRWLSNDPGAPAVFIMCDFRTKKSLFLEKEIQELREESANKDSMLLNLKRELSKQMEISNELSQSRHGIQDMLKESEERLKRYFSEVLLKSKLGVESEK